MSKIGETIAFYSGYEYVRATNRLFQGVETAIQWYNQPQEQLGRTAHDIYFENPPPPQRLQRLERTVEQSRDQLNRATEDLSWLVRKICRLVQTVLFFVTRADRYDGIIVLETGITGPKTRALRERLQAAEDRFPGIKISECEIAGERYNLRVHKTDKYYPFRISLENAHRTASFHIRSLTWTPVGKYFRLSHLQTTDSEELNKKLLQILAELQVRQEGVTALNYDPRGATPDLLKTAGFEQRRGHTGVWISPDDLHRALLPSRPIPLLPGEGPFLQEES